MSPAGGADLLVAARAASALLIYKLGERSEEPRRLLDKDAHDIYRLLVVTDRRQLAERFDTLACDDLAGGATRAAIAYLEALFSSTGDRLGAAMAGRAEELVGDPAVVAAAVTALADDLLDAME